MINQLPEPQRQSLMFANEGQVLQNAANSNVQVAVDAARAMIDGSVNGIIRLEGAKSAAEFLFALSDRAVSGVRGETPRPPSIEPFDPGKLKPKRAPWYERFTYSYGLAHGFLIALVLLAWLRKL
jgi:hypothetical protein